MSFPFIVKDTIADMRNLSPSEILDLQNEVYKGVHLLGYYEKGDTQDPIDYYLTASSNPDNGGSIIETGSIKLKHDFKNQTDVRYFGAIGDGLADDTLPIVSFFNYVNLEKLYWIIPGGFKMLVKQPFKIQTSGQCGGTFILEKETGEEDVTITIARSDEGQVVNISEWDNEDTIRGSLDVGFSNTGAANLHFYSTEVLIERYLAPPYNKTEFIRTDNGKLTTPLVCTYTNLTLLTVKKYRVENAITIENLTIEATGKMNDNRYLLISRDNVTLHNPRISNETGYDGTVALEIDKCADVTLNNPFIKGFKLGGVGYGIANYQSIGVVINDGNVIGCRHGYTGRNSVDVTINRGVWEEGIDDHWTDRFIANNPIVKTGSGLAAFQFAGNDVTLNSPVVNGSARIFFGIRLDTPNLGGIININNPVFNSKGILDIYLFSYTTPGGSTDLPEYANMPSLPQRVNIINPIINTNASTIYGLYLGTLNRCYSNLQSIRVTDTIVNALPTSAFISVLIIKDTVHQKKYTTKVEITGKLTTNIEVNTTSAYITSVSEDYDDRVDLFVTDCFGYEKIRFSGMSVANAIINGGDLRDFVNDNSGSTFNACNIQFKNLEFKGGSVHHYLTHALFQSCTFTGGYTMFPPATQVSLVNNVKYAILGLPTNITNNIVAPFV